MITNIKIGCYEDLTIKANKRFVIGHCKTTDRPVNRQTENEKKSQRFDKIKRGATQHTSRHTVAPHLLLPQRTSRTTNDCKF